MSRSSDIQRLEEIILEIKELLAEARHIFKQYPGAELRFKEFPYAHILCALDNEHPYLGGSFVTFGECIDFLRDDEDGKSDE